MSHAKDTSAIRYVATLIHRKNGVRTCRCFHCAELRHVVRLATAYVSLRRITDSKQVAR